MIYWDSDAFLGWLQDEAGKVELCAGTIERAKAGKVLIVTSALTIAEVLWMRGGPRVPIEKAETLNRFFRRSYLRVRNVTRGIAISAQDVVWNHNIKPKDAIHVATALDAGTPVLETFDENLIKRTGIVGSPPLIIRQPVSPRQTDLLGTIPR